MTGSRSGRIAAATLVAVLALAIAAIPASASHNQPFNRANFSGYATGQVLHTDALAEAGQVEEAWSGAAVNSNGLTAISNEMNRVVVPAQAAKKTYGRGSGLELGLGVDPATANQLQLQIAEAAAPPNSSVSTPTIELNQAAPLAYASVLTGEAEARWSNSSTCIIGQDLSAGRGFASDVQLLDSGESNEDGTLEAPLVAADADPDDPDRSVAWSKSHEFLAVQQNAAGNPIGIPGRFGLASEVRMTIAPVTIGDAVTLEFLGEWVLRVMAGGVPGSAHVHFGPGEASPQTPLVRIIQDNVPENIITLQDILGDEGLPTIEVPGVAEIRIGQPPHAIGDQNAPPQIATNGTSASAAIDIVSVELADGELADLRFGHMEVRAQVPVGGIDCGIPVIKSASPRGVTVNQSFVVTINILNPFGCDLTAVKVTDTITTTGDAKFQVLNTNPQANVVPAGANRDSGVIIWNNIGTIPKGGSKNVTVTIRAQGGGGVIRDIANVSAVLGNCEGEGEGDNIVGNSLPLQVPVVLRVKLPPTGVGSSTAMILGALMLLSAAGVAVRQMRRHA
jgi:hypothetical protein